ncbi:MAG TPA: 4-hydroxy-3-methylbut-2-enyl diphosphate reductase [Armatimonadota bacterium]|nr:4-hydroxy-3-methylbut-2-enyl diphosphate reductase [Armatimonadota bacterium]
MQVVLAESAGFCYGVKRAMDGVMQVARESGKPIYTLGPLIHNPQVIEKLESEGVKSVHELSEIPGGSVVVMPSHGVSKPVMDQARESGLEIIDLTCPFVSKVHRLAEQLVSEGYQVVVLGDPGHTEVKGIMSRAGEGAVAVSHAEDLSSHELGKRVGVLAQTTQRPDEYRMLVAEVALRAYEVRGFNTICNATTDRQQSALELASDVDVMIIVGGRNSANTRRLAEMCSSVVRTHHIEVAGELDPKWFRKTEKVGVTAGASTPGWIIEEVVKKLESL